MTIRYFYEWAQKMVAPTMTLPLNVTMKMVTDKRFGLVTIII